MPIKGITICLVIAIELPIWIVTLIHQLVIYVKSAILDTDRALAVEAIVVQSHRRLLQGAYRQAYHLTEFGACVHHFTDLRAYQRVILTQWHCSPFVSVMIKKVIFACFEKSVAVTHAHSILDS